MSILIDRIGMLEDRIGTCYQDSPMLTPCGGGGGGGGEINMRKFALLQAELRRQRMMIQRLSMQIAFLMPCEEGTTSTTNSDSVAI